MKPVVVIIFSIIALFLQSTSSVLTCFSCKNTPDPHNCSTVTRCSANGECYVDATYNVLRQVMLYNLGCRDTQICKLNTSSSATSVPGRVTVCSACCRTNICNTGELCGSYPVQVARKLLCYECKHMTSPDNCTHTTLCDEDSDCFLEKIHYGTHKTYLRALCQSRVVCNALNPLIGRRDVGLQGVNDRCTGCCHGDLCNDDCNNVLPQSHTTQSTSTMPASTTTTITTPVTTMPASTTTTTTPVTTTQTTTTRPAITTATTTASSTTVSSKPYGFPSIIFIKKPGPVILRSNITVKCIAMGLPEPVITWQIYTDSSLPPNVHASGPKNSTLTITLVTMENYGSYMCTATNVLGNDQRLIYIGP